VPANKQQLSNNNLLIIMVLVTVLVIGVAAFAIKFMWADITLDNRVLTAKNVADKQLTADVDAAPKLINDYNSLGADATTLADALPTSSDFPSLIVTLENLTNNAGVQLLRSVDAVPTTADSASLTGGTASTVAASSSAAPQPSTYKFSMDFQVTYPALLKLLSNIELSARPIRFTGLQFNGSGNNVSGELDMETYFQGKATLPFGTKEVK
jgi:hypothetical protein